VLLETMARSSSWTLSPVVLSTLVSLFGCAEHEPSGQVDAATEPDAGPGLGDAGAEPDAAPPPPDAGEPDAAVAPSFGGMTVDTAPDQQNLDLFGVAGHRFWLEVSLEQLFLMNEAGKGGPGLPAEMHKTGHAPLAPAYVTSSPELDAVPGPRPGLADPAGDGEIYSPGELEDESTFADHLVIKDALSGSVADYGKVEAALVGESTFREWNRRQIPNLRIDANQFQEQLQVGGFEHLRLNNGMVGSIFREHLAHRIFRALGYPALRSTFAFLGSNVWGPDVWVPMTLIEVYKKRFCRDNQELLGGSCQNMWEFQGNAGDGELPTNACQVSSCDNTRLDELANALAQTAPGAGFRAALEPLIDWPRFQAFQCLGWILATGDDALRNMNNNLIVERAEDHRLVWAPYSVDISAGQDWYPDTPLLGSSVIARGCQSDPACWDETYAVCEALLTKFDELDPERFVDETAATLTSQGMMRAKDEERAAELRAWLITRQSSLRDVLPNFRHLPDLDGDCPDPWVACNDGGCGTAEQCQLRLCPIGQVWCEASQACQGEMEVCNGCTGETPVLCPADDSCVSDDAACTALCVQIQGAGYRYCPAFGGCQLALLCPRDEPGLPGPL
jgi:hypothetical protein